MDKAKICYVASADITLKFLLFNQLNFLQKEGLEVFVACSSGTWIGSIEEEGIKVNTIRITRKLFSPLSDLVAFVHLFFYFKKEKFDIVHTHTPKAGFLGQLAAKLARVPVRIHTIHGLYFTEHTPSLKRKLFILVEKITAKFPHLIFSVNKEDIHTATKEHICSASKIAYLGGWVDLEKFNPRRFSETFIKQKKEALGIGPDVKMIGIVARFVKEKGYLELFEAFRAILEKEPKVLLLIIGQIEREKKDAINSDIFAEYGIQKNVFFLGERADVDEIYPLMDIFVLPSHREAMGLSILEASAMEKPVVATNIRGCREAVDDQKTGILVPIKNPVKLAEALEFLLKNPEVAEEMGKMGRLKVVKEFDERFIFNKLKEEYARLIKAKIEKKI